MSGMHQHGSAGKPIAEKCPFFAAITVKKI